MFVLVSVYAEYVDFIQGNMISRCLKRQCCSFVFTHQGSMADHHVGLLYNVDTTLPNKGHTDYGLLAKQKYQIALSDSPFLKYLVFVYLTKYMTLLL
jgi:hypothetical protein